MRVLGQERVERAQRLVRRPRPHGERALEAEEIRAALAGEPGVAERLLRRVRIVLEAAAVVRDPEAERVPDVHQAGVVLRLLEQRQRLPREPLELVDGRIGREERAVVGGADAGEQPRPSRRRPPAPARRRRRRSRRPSRCPVEERLGEVELEHDVEPRRPGQLERPLEQPRRPRVVAAPERAAAGGREPLARALGQRSRRAVRAPACSGRPARGGSRGSRPARPARRRAAPASRRSARAAPPAIDFRERVVGGVADQQVAEAEAVLARELRPVGTDQLPADERGQARRHLRSPPGRAPARRRGGRPRPRPRRARAPAARRRRAGRGGRRAAPASVGGTSTSSPASPAIASISAMKSGLPPAAARDPRAQLLRHARPDQAGRVLAAAAAPAAPSPATRGGRSSSSGRAMQSEQQRGAAGEQRHVLDQVEERLLAPLDVVEDRRRAAPAPRAACGTPRRSPPPTSPASDSPEQRTDRRRRGRIGGQRVELLDAPRRPASR